MNQNPDITQRQKDQQIRERIKRLWSEQPEVRLEAVENLKDAWGYSEPSFRVEELASMPHENCSIMAAKRDAQKELIDWLIKL